MGDRRMAEIKTPDGSLYVYTHWGGSEFPEKAKEAIIASQPRRGDTSYEARIIVDQLTKEGRDQETGFGLMVKPKAEDEYNGGAPSVIIDLVEQKLTVIGGGREMVSNFYDIGGN